MCNLISQFIKTDPELPEGGPMNIQTTVVERLRNELTRLKSLPASEAVSMPPDYYTYFGLHGDSKLTPAEKQQLIDGITTLPGFSSRRIRGSRAA